MTPGPAAAIEALIARVDWLADRGSLVMRAGAVVAWLGAVVATLAVFVELGLFGWILGVISLVPGLLLWRYGRDLESALDAAMIRGQIGDAAGVARSRAAEVVAGIRTTRRRPIRGGFLVLKTVRSLRSDLDDFGVDLSGIARVANPGRLALAGASLLIALGLWAIGAVGVVLRIAF